MHGCDGETLCETVRGGPRLCCKAVASVRKDGRAFVLRLASACPHVLTRENEATWSVRCSSASCGGIIIGQYAIRRHYTVVFSDRSGYHPQPLFSQQTMYFKHICMAYEGMFWQQVWLPRYHIETLQHALAAVQLCGGLGGRHTNISVHTLQFERLGVSTIFLKTLKKIIKTVYNVTKDVHFK